MAFMNRWRAFAILASGTALAGCGSDSPSGSLPLNGTDGGGSGGAVDASHSSDGDAVDGAAGNAAAGGKSGAGGVGGSIVPDASSDDGPVDAPPIVPDVLTKEAGDAGAPSPPAGYTKCGEGAATPAQVKDACLQPQTASGQPMDKACDAVTSTGAVWQVWCKAGEGHYVWIRWDGVTEPNPMTCPLTFDGAVYNVPHSGYLGIVNYEYQISSAQGGQIAYGQVYILDTVVSQSVEASFLVQVSADPDQGKVTAWMARSQDKSCSSSSIPYQTAVLGASVSWPSP
jgi:hypothetical protein